MNHRSVINNLLSILNAFAIGASSWGLIALLFELLSTFSDIEVGYLAKWLSYFIPVAITLAILTSYRISNLKIPVPIKKRSVDARLLSETEKLLEG